MPVAAQGRAAQQEVVKGWLFAETSSAARIAACLAVSVGQGGLRVSCRGGDGQWCVEKTGQQREEKQWKIKPDMPLEEPGGLSSTG